MHLGIVNEKLNHRISGATDYCWNCYGANAQLMDYESEYADISVVFDPKTQRVFEASVCSKNDNDDTKLYRWIDPFYRGAFKAECEARNINADLAWDSTVWVDLEIEEDWLEKATAIFNDQPFNKDIMMEMDFDDDLLIVLALGAHKKNVTLNEHINSLLLDYIQRYDRSVNDVSS